ncbi:hypothetical protein CfE428DRAFT_6634 [Chthoniobacter flavus Ellin428]|uniref:Uncharacterized protein n=1 Tax=Chthoniobacter flavus Ellin428 TaxID=497964 RepID=B4DCJ3_9BACT|nr:hypothetical protein [Chthoniobacter flavus]EDY15844.1 hypothetical protein CfE428DRAFT_6634 [Chthoniobacter flavus Ellin428]TCO87717.1 hypothetical protein EV701_12016 [Chthoniobacter flavus]
MKFMLKTAALLGVAMALAGTASAQTKIYISGATTYRACVHQAICEMLDSGFTFGCDNSNPYKQNEAIYIGKLNQGNPATDPQVIIKTYWTGSLAGVYDLSNQNVITARYPADSVAVVTSTGFGAQGQTTFGASTATLTAGYATENHAPTCVLTDAFQNSCAASISTATIGGAAAADAITNASLTTAGTAPKAGGAGILGLVAFQWVIGQTSATQAAVTNITEQQALALVNGGEIPVMFLSGSTADKNKYLLQIGRNEDSGSRINAHAEAQNGFGNGVVQFALAFNTNNTSQADGRQTGGSGSTVASFDVWPSDAALNTAPGINWQTAGHSGYIGGGDVKNTLISQNPSLLASTQGHTSGGSLTDTSGNVPAAATNVYFIGYLGTSDAAVGGNAIQLNYNGVPFSAPNVLNGSYSLWGYEHMYYLSSLTGVAQQTCDAIADQLFTTDADVNGNNGAGSISVHGTSGTVLQSGILSGAANVTRFNSEEGGIISTNY